MFTAVLGIVAALAFVLGLGALCIWALKRWGGGAIRGRQRVTVEVVQRLPLGPKTGLAVVRVGEKVIALSVGDGGVRQLFELDEADRQRVLATSPMPMTSSPEAAAAFPASFSPEQMGTALGTQFGSMLGKALKGSAPRSAPSAVAGSNALPPVTPFTISESVEIPSFLTAPLTTSRGESLTYAPASFAPASFAPASFAPASFAPVAAAPAFANIRAADRDFRALLNVSLTHSTKLAVFAGAMLLVGASSLTAQGAPPVRQAPVRADSTLPPLPTVPEISIAASDIGKSVVTEASKTVTAASPIQVVIPKTADAPAIALPKGMTQPPARVAPTPTSPAGRGAAPTPPPRPRVGNGADLTAQAAAVKRPTNDMQVTPAQDPSGKAAAATPAPIAADDAIMRLMPQMDVKLGGDGESGGLRLNGTVGVVVMMGLLTLLPTLLLMMTGFTRILIVLHFLKQAMGTQSAPPAQLLAGMALLLTAFVMGPTLSEVNQKAITPWLDGQVTQVEMLKTGVQPFRTFMLKQTRESDLKTFIDMSRLPRPNTVDDVPLHVLMSAFVASELRTAFQIGFAIYLPFIIIDAVVASVLMSMGMFMLPPAMISLPFKLLLFVLVDGWSLTISSLVQSFK